jgi:hypothetical protein
MFEAVSKVVLSHAKALQKTGLDLVNFGPFYGSKPSRTYPLDQQITVLPLKLLILNGKERRSVATFFLDMPMFSTYELHFRSLLFQHLGMLAALNFSRASAQFKTIGKPTYSEVKKAKQVCPTCSMQGKVIFHYR